MRAIAILPFLAVGQLGAATINFDSLVRGSILTNQLQASNILVSGNNVSGNGFQPGYVLDFVQGDLGIGDFGSSGPQGILYGIVSDELFINFVLANGSPATTDFVSVRVGDGDPQSESFRISFFSFGGNLLNSQDFTTTSGAVDGGVTASFSGAGIHRVEIIGTSGTGGAIDDLTFNSVQAVPEPSALGFLTMFFFIPIACRRRSKKA